MNQLTGISLFSGAVDGLAIAARAAGIHVTHHVEWDAWCCRVLRMNHPDSVVINADIKTVKGLPYADVIFGGAPCQDFSNAGKREGFNGKRYLWPEMRRLVIEGRPRCVVFENVRGAVSAGLLDRVCADLETDGYTAWPLVFPSVVFGAPHERYRMFVVGLMVNAISAGRGKHDIPRITSDSGHADRRSDEAVGDTTSQHYADIGTGANSLQFKSQFTGSNRGSGKHFIDDRRPEVFRFSDDKRAIPQPGLCRAADGPAAGLHRFDPLTAFPGFPAGQGVYQHAYEPPRTTPAKGEYANDRVQALGNAVVWQQAAPVFRTAVKWLEANNGHS
jgi:site-specific DNA-cytosine methylase